MPTIVEQIQRDALDPNIQIGSLLRRVKLAAAKLGLGKVEGWVESELNGYKDDVPSYRMIGGQPCAFNPARGMIPLQLSGGLARELSFMPVPQSISSIEHLARPTGENIEFRYSPAIQDFLRNRTNYPFPYYALVCGAGQMVQILDGVRTAVIDWAIELEKAGILGTEFSFTATERDKAQGASVTYNIGSIGNFTGNLGNGNISGDINSGSIDIEGCANVARQVARYADQLAEDGVNADDLRRSLNEVSIEADKREPNPGRLRAAMTDLRGVLSNAAGSLVASGAIEAITRLLG